MPQATQGMFFEYSIPLGLKGLLDDAIGGDSNNPNYPDPARPTANRQWFSQPRSGSDATTEVLQVNFKLPLSVSELGWEALRSSMNMEVWYQDRSSNWRQVLDESRLPVALTLSASTSSASWYKAHFFCYPIVARALQFRFTRINDSTVSNQPYVVGMRNALIRRNIYARPDGTMGIEPQQDILGNTITHYVKDWDASQAFDNNPYTFWRSMPMPTPAAVASLYLDCRDEDGDSQLVDKLYIDPVYINQALNVYYSNDDTVGVMKLSPIAAVPTTDVNTTWQVTKGRWDSSIDPGSSDYHFPMRWGPLVSQDAWIGIEWTPDFDPTSGPSQNPVLWEVIPASPSGGQYWPKIYYDVGAGEIVCTFTNGTTTYSYNTPLSPLFGRYQPLRIVVGWSYSPNTVFISVKKVNGDELGTVTANPSTLPLKMTLDGSVGFKNFRGLFTAHVVKLENVALGKDAFQANPGVYVSPDPVLPDPSGNIPATTLDNAIFAAAWPVQEQGTGGDHETRYGAKVWTPIWRDYQAQKGKLFFPQAVNLKFLKLEFTNLTEEPYPIYDSGIQTTYNVFPTSVTLGTSPPLALNFGGPLSLGADAIITTNASVNFLNPQSVNTAINSLFGQVNPPIQVQTGPGFITNSLPNTSQLDVEAQTRSELSTSMVYKRSQVDPSVLASQMITVASDWTPIQGMASAVADGSAIADFFFGFPSIGGNPTPTTLPVQGSDYWVFPGGTLRMPARMMVGLTISSQTLLSRDTSTEYRLRFTTTSVHRYDVKTATRDAAVAYFAGVREVQPYVTTYVSGQDPVRFSFSSYDSTQWTTSNTRALTTGPVTTAGQEYLLINAGFDQNIIEWTQTQGDWAWDGTTGHYFDGAATLSANGTPHELLSVAMDVAPGAHIDANCFVRWQGLVAPSGTGVIQLELLFYLAGAYVSTQAVSLSHAPWPNTSGDMDHPWEQIIASVATSNQFTAPSGVDSMRVGLRVTEQATAGQVWFDTVEVGTTDVVEATIFKDLVTTSTFAKVKCNFTDSGLVRSDDMWARQDVLDTNINFTALAYYTSTIPDQLPGGMWSDTFADWGDTSITWGTPRAVVAINVDPNRVFQGKRVLHFSRAGGAEEAGVKVRQLTNFAANGLFRLCALFYKPSPNTNQVTIRLRRVSDGVYIHEETFNPSVGYWHEYKTDFVEIPDSEDQVYTIELVCAGDSPDEFYLNDLYTEVALGRYFMRLGDSGQFLHDVTALRYADSAIVSCTIPVNEVSVEAVILSPKFFAYGCDIQPIYLR